MQIPANALLGRDMAEQILRVKNKVNQKAEYGICCSHRNMRWHQPISHGQRIAVDGDAGTVTLHESTQTLETISPADASDGM